VEVEAAGIEPAFEDARAEHDEHSGEVIEEILYRLD